MKSRIVIVVALLLAWSVRIGAQENAGTPAADLQAVVERVETKLRAGKASAADLAPEIAAFDALREKYRNNRSPEAARIVFLQATLHADILNDLDKVAELLTELKARQAATPLGPQAAMIVQMLEDKVAAKKAQDALIGKRAPALNFTWSTQEGLKTLADLEGKVVVLDFWATWCGPCIMSFPQMRELVDHYAGLDVVVLGVTSLQGRVSNLGPTPINTKDDPEREMALMHDFIKAKNITWPVVFSREEVFNPDYGVTGIPHMAIVAPDGTVRHSGLHPAMPHDEKVEKIDALLKEFGKPTAR